MSPSPTRANLKQIVKSLTALVGLSLFTYVLVFFASEATKVNTWRQSGDVRSDVRRASDSTMLFLRVAELEFAGMEQKPIAGDTLTRLGDSTATRARWDRDFASPQPIGKELHISYLHAGIERQAVIHLLQPRASELALIITLQVVRFLAAFLFVGVALWAFFKRPDSAGVRALALFSFSMSAFSMTGVQVFSAKLATFQIPFYAVIQQVLDHFSTFFGAFWLNLNFQFPQPLKFLQRRPVWVYSLCFAPTVLLVGLNLLAQVRQSPANLMILALVVISAQIFAGMTILAVRFRKAEDRVQKRQTRLVLWGSGVGLGFLLFVVILSVFFSDWFQRIPLLPLISVNIVFVGLLLSPLSFAYSFGRYRLLEVEARLRRGTRYAVALGILAVVIGCIGYAGGAVAKRNLESGDVLGFLILAVAVIGIIAGARVMKSRVEQWFYPERRRLRQMITDFLRETAALVDKREFWMLLEAKLRDGLMVEGVFPVLRAENNGTFIVLDRDVTPFRAESDLVLQLESEQRLIMIDEAVVGARVRLSDDESSWLAERRVAVVLPLLSRSRLIGFLGLGEKTEREDFAAEELRILTSLSSQVALASENIRLLEENVGKKRLEEQLDVARKIQNGFLPSEMPTTPGLELQARCHFCLEVAGDYYDIISLESGETVLAVGDVSGKGAGAALLMANLQASLRTAVGMDIPLTNVVARINDLIYHNTPPEQFITFFVGLFDPHTRTLRYVNAGHNPPLYCSPSGRMYELDQGGLLLGAVHSVTYELGEQQMEAGGLLLLYTDGVSEAMNAAEEEFGDERLREQLRAGCTSSPAELLNRIEQDVTAFHGSTDFEDDFTLLLARVAN
jgi:phosphoserine phosphatase RsbU/P